MHAVNVVYEGTEEIGGVKPTLGRCRGLGDSPVAFPAPQLFEPLGDIHDLLAFDAVPPGRFLTIVVSLQTVGRAEWPPLALMIGLQFAASVAET